MSMVIAIDGESIEHLLQRFKMECIKSGVLEEVKKRQYFMSAHDKRIMKMKESIKRKRSKKNKFV